jgi:hypothetical protein
MNSAAITLIDPQRLIILSADFSRSLRKQTVIVLEETLKIPKQPNFANEKIISPKSFLPNGWD